MRQHPLVGDIVVWFLKFIGFLVVGGDGDRVLPEHLFVTRPRPLAVSSKGQDSS